LVVPVEDDIVGRQFTGLHHTGLGRKHDALLQLENGRQRRLLNLPAFSQLALDRIGWYPGVRLEGVFAACACTLGKVGDQELFVGSAGIVIDLPGPILGIPTECRDRCEDGRNLQRAAILRLGGILGERMTREQNGGAKCGPEPAIEHGRHRVLPGLVRPLLRGGVREE
jgi:hypothetical protein